MTEERYVILDTETTGMEVDQGDKIVEIGGVEVLGRRITGNRFQRYISPCGRAVDPEALRVHGISDEFLADKPPFKDIAKDFIDFAGDGFLVIHNAKFDMKFLNAELVAAGFAPIPAERVIDTMPMARERFPGQAVNLNALCRRFKVDNSDRQLHGALKDAELLARVYLELLGDPQQALDLTTDAEGPSIIDIARGKSRAAVITRPATPEEKDAHGVLLDKLDNPLWRRAS